MPHLKPKQDQAANSLFPAIVPGCLQTLGRTAPVCTQANNSRLSLQPFRTEKGCVAAIKIPRSSVAILGRRFTAGRWGARLLCSAPCCPAWWRRGSRGVCLPPRQNLEGSVCGGLLWDPQAVGGKLQADRKAVLAHATRPQAAACER